MSDSLEMTDAAPEAAQAKKTTRRRTVKPKEETATAPAAEVAEAPVEKKPARRTRKATAEKPEAAVPAAVDEAPAKPTRRRTRAAAVAEPVETAEKPETTKVLETEKTAEQKPEKKTTRARRAKKAAEGAEDAAATAEKTAEKPEKSVKAPADVAEKAADAPTVPTEPAEEKPARRTRRAKTAVPADAAPTEKASAEPAPAPDAAAPAEPSEGQSGRHDREKRKSHTVVSGQDKKQPQDKQGANDHKQQGGHNDRRRNRRNQQREVVPSVSLEELAELKVAELREKAAELGLDGAGMKKTELIEAVYAATLRAEGFMPVSGVLDVLSDGYGFLRTSGYLPGEHDVYVATNLIRRNGLRKGDLVTGTTRPPRDNEKYVALQKIDHVNGVPLEEMGARVKFGDLTPVYPDERLWMEHGKNTITARVIDLAAPIGKGQRGLIVSPPKAGKTTILKDIAASISANNPEVHLMCLLVDERPEEVTDMERSIKGEVISSTFDMPCENHIAVAELVIERAKRLVENGADVVILLDSLTRLARAYNLAQPASGRILSGGVDSTALYPPKRFLGAARNIEHGGSLTILASALIDTGSKMDEVIFEEFKGTGNMELKLDRNLADRRIFPAIDPISSGTRKEDLLLEPQEAPLIWAVRRLLSNLNNTERAMDMLIKSLKQTNTNQEFLIRTAKKAQTSKSDGSFEL